MPLSLSINPDFFSTSLNVSGEYTSGSTAHAGYVELAGDLRLSPALRAQLVRAVAHIHALERWLGRSC